MADFDVSMRLGIDYRPDDAKRAQEDLEAIRRAGQRLGAQPRGRGLADDLDRTAREAKAAKDAIDRLAGSQDRLKDATGTEVLRREAQRLGAAYERAETRAKELRAASERLKGSDGATVLSRELRQVEQASGRSQASLEQLRRAAQQLGAVDGVEDLKSDLDRLTGSAQRTDAEIDQVRDSVRQLGRENGAEELRRDFDRAETSARRVETRIDRIRQAGTRLGRGAVSGGGGGRDFAEETLQRTGMGGLAPIVRGGPLAGAVAAAAPIYGAYRATNEAMQLETAMAEVRRQVNGVDETGIERLRNGILRLSEETGVAKEQIASLVANAAKAGTAAEDLLPFASYASKFAVAADMQQGEAGQVLALLKSQFNIDQARIPQVLDSVNYLADRSATSERDVLDFMGRAAPSANIAGLSPEQLAAFGTGFLNVGTQPEVAGTGFNALTMRLGTASQTARKDKDFRRSLGRLGLNGRELQAGFYDDSAETILDVFERVQTLPKDQQLEVLKGLGGQEYGDDFAKITGQTQKIRGFLDDAQSPAARGSVEATFAASNDTTARDLAKASAALASLGTELGETFLPAVRIFAQAVARFAGGWAESIRQERVKDAIVEKMVAGQTLAGPEAEEYGTDQVLKDSVDAEVDRRRQAIERHRRQAEDYDLRNMDDPEAQEGAAGRALAERSRADTVREIEEGRRVLDVLTPEQQGYRDTQRKLENLEKRLMEIDETLKQGFGQAKASPIGFFGGSGEGRVINASLGRGGSAAPFRNAYGGSTPQMDGTAGAWSGGRGSGGAGGAPFGGGSAGSVNATQNPGGAAGEIYDVLSTSFNDAQSFALLGHMEQESGLDPNAWNPKESAGGLIQWRDNRLANLKRFASDKGMDWRDRKVQAAFISHEMETDPYERKRSAKFRSATTVEGASAALKDYIRFGDDSGGTRLSNARGFANAFGAKPNETSSDAARRLGVGDPRAIDPNTVIGSDHPIWDLVDPDLAAAKKSILGHSGSGRATDNISAGALQAADAVFRHARSQGVKMKVAIGGGSNQHSANHGSSGLGEAIDIKPDGGWRSKDQAYEYGKLAAAAGANRLGVPEDGHGLHVQRTVPKDAGGTGRPTMSWSYGAGGGGSAGRGGSFRSKLLSGGLVTPEDKAYVDSLYGGPGAKAIADGAEPMTGPTAGFDDDGWSKDPSRRPKAKAQSDRRPGAGAGPGRSPSGPVSPTINQHFHGVDPQIMAMRAARAQKRSIRSAEARAMHDTSVPVA